MYKTKDIGFERTTPSRVDAPIIQHWMPTSIQHGVLITYSTPHQIKVAYRLEDSVQINKSMLRPHTDDIRWVISRKGGLKTDLYPIRLSS